LEAELIAGPVFAREFATAPRRLRFYVGRTAAAAGLLIVLTTAAMLVTGQHEVRHVGDLARFGQRVFPFLAPLQLVLAMLFAGLLTAGSVAQEKDRRTLSLLLMTRLSNADLVLGKWLASLLVVLVGLAAGLPVLTLGALFGGYSFSQIFLVEVVTTAAALAAASWGCLIAYWRETTFQALALTVLGLVCWLFLGEVVRAGVFGAELAGLPAVAWALVLSPVRALEAVALPNLRSWPALAPFGHPALACVACSLGLALSGLLIAVQGVRRWNSGGARERLVPLEEQETIWGAEHDWSRARARWRAGVSGAAEPVPEKVPGPALETDPLPSKSGTKTTSEKKSPRKQRHRVVWDHPILWRELRTWAYGRKLLAIRIAYAILAAVSGAGLVQASLSGEPLTGLGAAAVLAPLGVVSLLLINAQAVTSLSSERDGGTLDLLLVSDLSPQEIIYGKIGGIWYNARETIVWPLVLCVGLSWMVDDYGRPLVTTETLTYLVAGCLVLFAFASVLGLHVGMTYVSSRQAIAISLGTLIFLCVGTFTCIRMLVTFSGTFDLQLFPFLLFMLGGGVALFAALGARNPSAAILMTSFLSPWLTFYAITSFLLGQTLNVFLAVILTYGFATASMLVPAVSEFDVALGRTTDAGGD